MQDQPQIPAHLDPRDVTTDAQAASKMHRLADIFSELGILIPPGSDFEEVWLNVPEMKNKRVGKTAVDWTQDMRPLHRKVLGLLDISPRIIRAYERGHLAQMQQHLELMTKCVFAQNVPTLADEASNKVFELLLGLVCSEIGTELVMDSPTAATGNNPDVMFTSGDQRWGIACKVMNGYSAFTMFDRIEEGVAQIDASPADIGCVAINLRNVIDHDFFWPILHYENGEPVYGVWTDYQMAVGKLLDLAAERHFQLEEDNSKAQIDGILAGKRSVKGVLLFLQTSLGAQIDGKVVQTSLGILNVMKFGEIADADFHTLQRMNEALHGRY